MANKVQIRRGAFANLPALSSGEPAVTTDTRQVYVGGADGVNIELKTAPPASALTFYIATAALGGRTLSAGATGLQLATGTNTSIAANKLIDSGANFTTALVGMSVYNVTDDTWAKVTARDSATQLALSANIFLGTGKTYVICDTLDNIPEAFSKVYEGYKSNQTIRISPGTFPDDLTFIGKTAGDNFTFTVQGSTTGTTTLSGKTNFRQKLTPKNLTFTGKVYAYFGADLSWYSCVTSGASKLYVYPGSANRFDTCTITFGNDPREYTAINSTITKGYTMYAAPASLGGDDTIADGLLMYTGSATSTTANKLVDSAANFGTDVVGKTLYNSTDDTWVKVTARDSATQLSLSADIMASGEGYIIANAFATVQGAINAIPGTYNCDTFLKLSDYNFNELATMQGKNASGSYGIYIYGTPVLVSSHTVLSATNRSITVSGTPWAVNGHKGKLIILTSGSGGIAFTPISYTAKCNWIESNTADTLNFSGIFTTNPAAADTFKIVTLGTTVNLKLQNGQKGVYTKYLKYAGGAERGLVHADVSIGVHEGLELSGSGGIDINNGSAAYLFLPYIHGGSLNAFNYELFVRTNSVAEAFGLWTVFQAAGNTYGVGIATQSHINVRQGCIIDGYDTGVYGIIGATGQFFTGAKIQNCATVGVKVEFLAFFRNRSNITFTGNTLDYSEDATTSAHFIV